MVDDITLSELNAKIRFKVKWIAQRGDRWGRHLTHKFTSRSLNDLTSKICQLKFHRTFLNVSSSSDVAPTVPHALILISIIDNLEMSCTRRFLGCCWLLRMFKISSALFGAKMFN